MDKKIKWAERSGSLKPLLIDERGKETEAVWAPQPGSQEIFLSCPVYEALIEGTRGGGKTDTLIMDFAQHVGQGFGAEWRGVLFRRTYPELEDVIAKSKRWFGQIFPEASYNEAKSVWTWPTGESLRFRHFKTPDDYWGYHGHCVPEGEVRVKDVGWVPIQSLTGGELVLSAHPKTREICWAPVDWVIEEDYDGELVQYNQGRELRYMSFTPNHKLPTADGRLLPYEEMGKRAKVQVAGFRRDHLPVAQRWPGAPDERDFVEFMAYWWLVGSIHRSARQMNMRVSYLSQEARVKMVEVMRRMGIKHHVRKDGTPCVTDRKWLRALLPLCPAPQTRMLPDDFMHSAHLEVFLETIMGSRHSQWYPEVGRQVYKCHRKVMAEQLAELALAAGHTVRMNPFTYIQKNIEGMSLYIYKHTQVIDLNENKNHLRRVPFKGKVYCLGVRGTHTFFLRQRQHVWLSGNSYPWIAWEELTTWATDECFKTMFSCSRSPMTNIPLKVRATTNPYGIGHHWVKERYRLPVALPKIVGPLINDSKDDEGNIEPERIAIHSDIHENRVLLHADPGYIQRIASAARNKSERDAWVHGSWDIVSGGMFHDVFDRHTHVLPDILGHIPETWKLDRSFDWGSSKPFSVGWWAESDGSDLILPDGKKMSTVKGDLFRVAEWYGWTGKANVGLYMSTPEIALGIKEREEKYFPGRRVRTGVADASIFDPKPDSNSIAIEFAKHGVVWEPSNKTPGSRKRGWEHMRTLLKNALVEGPRQEASLFVTQRCDQWLRIVPALPRDDKDLDDVDTDAEDHAGDETRYRVYKEPNRMVRKKLFGR